MVVRCSTTYPLSFPAKTDDLSIETKLRALRLNPDPWDPFAVVLTVAVRYLRSAKTTRLAPESRLGIVPNLIFPIRKYENIIFHISNSHDILICALWHYTFLLFYVKIADAFNIASSSSVFVVIALLIHLQFIFVHSLLPRTLSYTIAIQHCVIFLRFAS